MGVCVVVWVGVFVWVLVGVGDGIQSADVVQLPPCINCKAPAMQIPVVPIWLFWTQR